MVGDELDIRKRRIRFRATHRGMKEMDLLLGRLAEDVLPQAGPAEVAAFERLLEVPDAELMDCIANAAALPTALAADAVVQALLEKLRKYRFSTESYGANL